MSSNIVKLIAIFIVILAAFEGKQEMFLFYQKRENYLAQLKKIPKMVQRKVYFIFSQLG